ncbi:hypothetical protein SCP_0116430 [Sparassis crispa]|uniref:Zinc-finger domain-containing protein n=1 Tax=Sparassis crispa TaxID=139825 RepID=A0A401G9B3_9APHY|nr:hypothetical protein SCP_0116430 [Sparassis crispa]GBE78751.1 hypothetical protein SCP_0116430 [Sparassis crispa]
MPIYSELANWDGSLDRHYRQRTPPSPPPSLPPAALATTAPSAATTTITLPLPLRLPPSSHQHTSNTRPAPAMHDRDSTDVAAMLLSYESDSEVPSSISAERVSSDPDKSAPAVKQSPYVPGADAVAVPELFNHPLSNSLPTADNDTNMTASVYARSKTIASVPDTSVQMHSPMSNPHPRAVLQASPQSEFRPGNNMPRGLSGPHRPTYVHQRSSSEVRHLIELPDALSPAPQASPSRARSQYNTTSLTSTSQAVVTTRLPSDTYSPGSLSVTADVLVASTPALHDVASASQIRREELQDSEQVADLEYPSFDQEWAFGAQPDAPGDIVMAGPDDVHRVQTPTPATCSLDQLPAPFASLASPAAHSDDGTADMQLSDDPDEAADAEDAAVAFIDAAVHFLVPHTSERGAVGYEDGGVDAGVVSESKHSGGSRQDAGAQEVDEQTLSERRSALEDPTSNVLVEAPHGHIMEAENILMEISTATTEDADNIAMEISTATDERRTPNIDSDDDSIPDVAQNSTEVQGVSSEPIFPKSSFAEMDVSVPIESEDMLSPVHVVSPHNPQPLGFFLGAGSSNNTASSIVRDLPILSYDVDAADLIVDEISSAGCDPTDALVTEDAVRDSDMSINRAGVAPISAVHGSVPQTPPATRILPCSLSPLSTLESSPPVPLVVPTRQPTRTNRAYVFVPPLPPGVTKESYKSASEFAFLQAATTPAPVPPASASASAPPLKRKRGCPSNSQAQRKKPRAEAPHRPADFHVDVFATLVPNYQINVEDEIYSTPGGVCVALRHLHKDISMVLSSMQLREPAASPMRKAPADADRGCESLFDEERLPAVSSGVPTPGITPDTANASTPQSRLTSPMLPPAPNAVGNTVPLGGLSFDLHEKTRDAQNDMLFHPGPIDAFPDSFLGFSSGTVGPWMLGGASHDVDMDMSPDADHGFGFGDGTIDPSLLGAPPMPPFEVQHYSPSSTPSPPPAAHRRLEVSMSPVAGPSRLPARDKAKAPSARTRPKPPSENSWASEHELDVIVVVDSLDDEYKPARDVKPKTSAKAKSPLKPKAPPNPKPKAPPRPKPHVVFEMIPSKSIFDEEIVSGKRVRKPSARVLATQSISPAPASLSSLSSLDSDNDDAGQPKQVITRVGPLIDAAITRVGPPVNAARTTITCHHCRRSAPHPKMRCTAIRNDQVCGSLYCHVCISKRYPEIIFDADAVSFTCPRCLDMCNCDVCCRKRGVPYVSARRGPARAGFTDADGAPAPARVLTPTPTPPPEYKWTAPQGAFWGTVYGMHGERVGPGFLGNSSGIVLGPSAASRAPSGRRRVYVGKPQPHWRLLPKSDSDAGVVSPGVRAYVGDVTALRLRGGHRSCSPWHEGVGNVELLGDAGHAMMEGNDGVDADADAVGEVDIQAVGDDIGFVIAEALHLAKTATMG